MTHDHYLGCFGSDNFAPVCEEVMRELLAVNHGPVPSYGKDKYTETAIDLIKQEFEQACDVFFVFNGTGANISALKCLTRSINAIICADTSHIHTQETGAVYAHTGCKLLLIPSKDGKITPEEIAERVEKESYWGRHATKPKVVSLSQATEFGTVYTLAELQRISETCKKHALLLHVDGCRLYNAAVALDCPLQALCREAGVDVLSLGGTKNGLMLAEAVVFFNQTYSDDFAYIQKQTLQLASKMRYISAQFIPFFRDKLWHRHAAHANAMAQRLAEGVSNIPGVLLSQKVETNQLFMQLPKDVITMLRKDFFFHVWNESLGQIRLITSFDTAAAEVDAFLQRLQQSLHP